MSIIRNNIEIEGIKQNENVNYGSYVLNHWENCPVFLPRSKGKIKYLTKVIIELNSIEGSIINTPAGKVLSIYGRKVYSLIYSEKSHDRSQRSSIDLPFLSYIYLPKEIENFCNLEVSVTDAFFEVIDNRKVYSHILYLIKFDKKEKEDLVQTIPIAQEQGQLTLGELEKMIMSSPLKDVLKTSNLTQSPNENIEKISIKDEGKEEEKLEDNPSIKGEDDVKLEDNFNIKEIEALNLENDSSIESEERGEN